MENFSQMQCIPCRGGDPPLSEEEINQLKLEIPEWRLIELNGVNRLERIFKFRDFSSALDFTNRVGETAEAQDHHPALLTEWGRVTVTWWTHTIKGLHKNDFVMAAKTDRLYQ